MQFLIADTFTDSLARLTGEEQKAVKTTAFDLQMNPANPGMSFHKLDKAKDKNFWSVRVSSDIRLIVHKTSSSLLLCYVDHHDKAYEWAQKRKLERHPKTGAAQIVEIRETVKEVIVPIYHQKVYYDRKIRKLPVLSHLSDDDLLAYGVPSEWLIDVKTANEDTLLSLIDHLPAEASEALLELATGGQPSISQAVTIENQFDHPDAQRRFRVVENIEELQRAFEYPWEKWSIFLHPDQRQWVGRDFNGPARVSGSAGTGKTIVALQRAVHLARKNPDSRVLLTTFSDALANILTIKLKRLIGNEPRLGERIDVYSIDAVGKRLYKSLVGEPSIIPDEMFYEILKTSSDAVPDHKFSISFLVAEWDQVVDGWQVESWEEYRDVVRLGRKTRLPQSHREILWSIFEQVSSELKRRNLITVAGMFEILAAKISNTSNIIYDFSIIDEAQDISVTNLKFFAALGNNRPNSLFFAGDLGQRIFQQPFSWKSLGVDIQGRSKTLRVNYRTSHQIRTQADKLLDTVITDIDGNSENRSNTLSVFNGPPPTILTLQSAEEEAKAIGDWLVERSEDGVLPHEFGVFVRSKNQLDRAKYAVEQSGLSYKVLDENVEISNGYVSISTMHFAKGLEFRAVVVMACDDEVIPLQERIERVGDDADLQEVYDTERHLLYVACTRARDFLFVTSVEPASEFIDDMVV